MAEKKKSHKAFSDTEVSTTELAAVLGLTARRVQQLAQDGTIYTDKKGRFLLCDSVQRYISFITQKIKEPSEQGKEKETAEVAIKKSKAVIAMLEAKELQGKMHRAEDVEAAFTDLVFTIRSALLALPSRLAIDVSKADSSAEAAVVIRNEIYNILTELSNYKYDPEAYEKKVRDRRNWDALDVDGI